jgi:hypothetical protein|tara:strand:- start:42 stop:278 length:237 start_codon:yes stop_codon:yes gene_type:complete
MKEPSKHMLNGIIIVLVAIIIALTFTINYSSPNKHCYKKVYARYLIVYSGEAWKDSVKTREELEGKAAAVAARRCFIK